MSEQILPRLRREQEEIKPVIENVICKLLDGDAAKRANDFVAYLRANGLPPKWASLNGWMARNKGDLCGISVGNSDVKTNSWRVTLYLNHLNTYGELVASEGLQGIIWDGIFHCTVNQQNGCDPSKSCAGGDNRTILGKEIKNICRWKRGRKTFINNPDETTLKGIKLLLNWEINARKHA